MKTIDIAPQGPVIVDGKPQPSKRPEWVLQRGRYLLPEEAGKLLAAAQRFRDGGWGFFTLYFSVNVGSRISETLAVRAGDVHPTEGRVRVKTLKQRVSTFREVLLSPEATKRVRDWIVDHNLKPEDRLIPRTRQWAGRKFDQACYAAGLKSSTDNASRLGIHSLRHCCALTSMRRMAESKDVSALEGLVAIGQRLGHKNLRSTLVYLGVGRAEKLAECLGEIGADASATPPEPAPAPAAPSPGISEVEPERAAPVISPEVQKIVSAAAALFQVNPADVLNAGLRQKRLTIVRGSIVHAGKGGLYDAADLGRMLGFTAAAMRNARDVVQKFLDAGDPKVGHAVTTLAKMMLPAEATPWPAVPALPAPAAGTTTTGTDGPIALPAPEKTDRQRRDAEWKERPAPRLEHKAVQTAEW